MFYTIQKITAHPVVDFAAEELKKYLRMMMPRCGEITITYAPDAGEGFRLGVMEDFALDVSEAEDLSLDDIIHIDTDAAGGILAGSNPRSVLLAVYKYLTLNGCRWLFPGIDGEKIPIRPVEATYFHKMADCRYRGQCNEGAEIQQSLLETIDFSPKIGLNMYMIEFDNPHIYYDWFYQHKNNPNRRPEPVRPETVLQWKRVCEVEIAKRGLQFHDKGHGWTADAFGIDSSGGWDKFEKPLPEETRQYLACVNGQRGLFQGVALNTNFCMSNREARRIFINHVADYAQLNFHVDYLHVWLADGQQNHCECASCCEKSPSDWYVILLNELDEEMTRRNLRTRVVFCAYSDTAWPPQTESLKNPHRFSMITSPITRSYTYSAPQELTIDRYVPYVRNRTARLDSLEEHLAHTTLWRKFAPCNSFVCEYHFWVHQFFAPGVLSFAKRLHADVKSFRLSGFRGIVEDCSQRCFFPNGLSFFVYAATLFDVEADLEGLIADYLSHAYGEAAPMVRQFLETIDRLMPQEYMEIRHSYLRDPKKFYAPAMEAQLLQVQQVAAAFREQLKAFRDMPCRVQTVAIRLMEDYADYCSGIAAVMALKCVGKDQEAKEAYKAFALEFGKREQAIERYYDHYEANYAMQKIVNNVY